MGSARAGALADKTAVVVGAAGGIGRAAGRALVRHGARIVVSDRDERRLRHTVGEIARLRPGAAVAVPADVRSDQSVRALARTAVKTLGRIDIVVNAAALPMQRPLERTSSRDWARLLDTNLVGAVRTATAFLPYMLDRGAGRIVNAISVGGLVPGDALTIAYDSGYAALAAYTHSLDRLLRSAGIRASLYVVGSTGPLPGFRGRAADQLAEGLIEGLAQGRFLILADPKETASLRRRWEEHELAGRLEIAIRNR